MKSALIAGLIVWIIFLGHKVNDLNTKIEAQNTVFLQCISHGGSGFIVFSGRRILDAALCIPVNEAGH